MRRRISAWLRWQLAVLMNRLDDTCWTCLVMWALNLECHPFGEILDLRHTRGNCEARGEVPFCGKCGGAPLHQRGCSQ